MCIKLVNYWDKYTEIRGQQNVKISIVVVLIAMYLIDSAAGLYMTDYIHPYVEAEHEEARPLRIYNHEVSTSPAVLYRSIQHIINVV